MRTDALYRFTSSAELWLPVTVNNPDGSQTITWTYEETFACLLAPNMSTVIYISTKEALPIGAMVKNIKDKTGKELVQRNGDDQEYFVDLSQPEITGYGNLVGWKSGLKRQRLEDLINQRIDDILGSVTPVG